MARRITRRRRIRRGGVEGPPPRIRIPGIIMNTTPPATVREEGLRSVYGDESPMPETVRAENAPTPSPNATVRSATPDEYTGARRRRTKRKTNKSQRKSKRA